MKKGKLFLTILASMALVACNEPTSTSGSTSKPSTSDSVSTSTVEKFNVEVVGGTGGGNDITSGSSVTVVADEPEEGKKFVKWVDENGNTVSTDKSYTFMVSKSVKLTATYETLKTEYDALKVKYKERFLSKSEEPKDEEPKDEEELEEEKVIDVKEI